MQSNRTRLIPPRMTDDSMGEMLPTWKFIRDSVCNVYLVTDHVGTSCLINKQIADSQKEGRCSS